METALWAAKVDRSLTEAEQASMRSMLPPERRARLERTQPAKQREVLCAYTLLRMALWKGVGMRKLPDVALSPFGKPYFPGYPEIQFNLSHTLGAVFVGVSDQPIGVDIEKLRPVGERVMRRIAGVESAEEFFRRWVALEARGKRTGRGVGTLLDAGKTREEEESYYPIEVFPAYLAGVALGPGRPCPEVHIFTI